MIENVKSDYKDKEIYRYFSGELKESEVEKFNIGQITFNNEFINDVAFMRNKNDWIIVLEHQGKRDDNIGLRMMMYYTEMMKKFILDNNIDIYRKVKKIELPRSQFLIAYNGLEDDVENFLNIEVGEFEQVLELGRAEGESRGKAKGKAEGKAKARSKELNRFVGTITILKLSGVGDEIINKVIEGYKLNKRENILIQKKLNQN